MVLQATAETTNMKTENMVETFHKMIGAIPERDGFEIMVQTHDIHGWINMTRDEAMHSCNSPGGLNGLTTVFYWKDGEVENMCEFRFPFSFSEADTMEGDE